MVPQSAPLSEYLGALVAGEGGELVGSVGLVLPPVPLQLLTGQESLVTLLTLPGELRLLFPRCLCIHEILKIHFMFLIIDSLSLRQVRNIDGYSFLSLQQEG